MMGVYQYLRPQQINKYMYMKYLHCTCPTVTSLYSKNSVFIPPQRYSNTVINKKRLTVAGLEEKRANQLSGTSRLPSRQATVLAYMLTGQSPRQAIFQSNQAGLQIIFVD